MHCRWTITVLASPKVGCGVFTEEQRPIIHASVIPESNIALLWYWYFEVPTFYCTFSDAPKSLRLKDGKWMPTFQESEFLTASSLWSSREVMNISDSDIE